MYWSPISGDKEKNAFPDGQDWTGWQQSGNDSASLWKDPMFEDAANHNYALTPESPAWGLGIQQIDQNNIGIIEMGKYHAISTGN